MVNKRVQDSLNIHKIWLLFKNTNNFHTFEAKVDTLMSHVIWFECWRSWHIENCAMRRLVEMCRFFLAFENTERLWIHIKNWTLEQIVTHFSLFLCFISFILHLSYFFFFIHIYDVMRSNVSAYNHPINTH
jgi:hypothetical protein